MAVKNLRIVASLLYHSLRLLDPQLPEVAVEFKEVIIKKDIPVGAVAPSPEDSGSVSIDVKDSAKPDENSKSFGFFPSALTLLKNFFLDGNQGVSSATDVNCSYSEFTLLDEKRHGFDSLQNLHNFLLPQEYFTSKDVNRTLFSSVCRDTKSKVNTWLTRMCILAITYKLRKGESRGLDESALDPGANPRLPTSRSKSPEKERLGDPSIATLTSRSRGNTASSGGGRKTERR